MFAGSDLFFAAMPDAALTIAKAAGASPGAIDWGQIALIIAAGLFGGGAFWGFLRATRSATSTEYQSFVRDLQQERRDREREFRRVLRRLRMQERRTAQQELEFAQMDAHVARLENEITRLGGTVPVRPARKPWDESAYDDDDADADDEPLGDPASRPH